MMTQEENVLLHKCKIVNQEVSRVKGHYNSCIGNSSVVISQLSKAENRSKEYENGTFIVLVVGPVKSGKSTLVNLIANAYVSPTHFLECTVRPSIISQRRGKEDCKITVFTSEDTSNRIEQIDAIIDCIRGIESEDSLENIHKGVFDLTPENIKQKVELGLKDSLSSETLVTSITTPGGKLMKQDVFIVDMPGFDGEYANIDDPVYDTIAQRADLIIFVQSSNSAISKVSGQFLKTLAENNQDVPVCLIHNVFDSLWWRSNEERSAAALKQKEFAICEIRKQGFNIDESQCFSINLGKVEDSRKQVYSDIPALTSEAEEYDKIEGILYDRVINRRDSMRLNVSLSRTRQQLGKTVASIDDELNRRSQLSERYEQVTAEFAKIDKSSNFQSGLQPLIVDYNSLKNIIRNEAQSTIGLVDTSNNHKTDTEATGIVVNFIGACEITISASFGKSLSLDQKEEELLLVYKNRINEIKEVSINCGVKPLQVSVDRLPIEGIPTISLLSGVDLNLLIPRKPMINLQIKQFGGHSAEDIVGYINKTAERLAGSAPGEANYIEGYIEKEGGAIKPILDQVNLLIEEVTKKYEDICLKYWENSCKAVLQSIIADKQTFDAETMQLKSLKEELIKILEQI